MTPMQNLYLMIFFFLPAVILGIYKEWWVGILALVFSYALSWLLMITVSMNIPEKLFHVWAWIKPPLTAIIVLLLGWTLF